MGNPADEEARGDWLAERPDPDDPQIPRCPNCGSYGHPHEKTGGCTRCGW